MAQFEELQKAELGTGQKEQPGGREGGVSEGVQGFVVEGRGSRELPRRERRILSDPVMAVLCAQLTCEPIVGWCLERGGMRVLKLEVLNTEDVKGQAEQCRSHPCSGSVCPCALVGVSLAMAGGPWLLWGSLAAQAAPRLQRGGGCACAMAEPCGSCVLLWL